MTLRCLPALLALLALLCGHAALAQTGMRIRPAPPVQRDQPVFYQADSAEYDREAGLVTLSGNVIIWQNDRELRADRVTYDRNTGVAAAHGNVVMMEPNGQVVFADYAELSGGMKNGVMTEMRALLAENGKLAAAGARRTDGVINEMARSVYTTCNLCKEDPTRPPLWDVRARSAVQDTENKLIEYKDAVIDIYGVPVMWLPWMTHPDPSQKRASGILVPSPGYSSKLGAFMAVPYYWAIDRESDATITPIVTSKAGQAVDLQYRRAFNDGRLRIDGSIANYQNALNGHVFAKGEFSIDETWRWGFDINRASSIDYMRDFRVRSGVVGVLTSQAFVEGFGQGSYALLDTRAYQGLTSNVIATRLPYVLPRYEYSFVSTPDALGGRVSVDTGAFNVYRENGTRTQRANLRAQWDRPFVGENGDLWKVSVRADSAGYAAQSLNLYPNYGSVNGASTAQGMVTGAVQVRWPFSREAGDWGTQIIEPILQGVVAPNGSKYVNTKVPNEDSIDQELSDTNLFSLNRFPGVDRMEGGVRASVGLHAAWWFPNGATIDGLVGQSYRTRKDPAFIEGSGLTNPVSDVVSRLTLSPTRYLDLTTRWRFDPKRFDVNFADAIATAGPSWLRMSGGYIYSATTPYPYYQTPPTGTYPGPPRNEITLGASTAAGPFRVSGWARRDLQTGKMVGVAVGGTYEDECFIFDIRYYRRYTSVNNDSGSSAVLFQITLKTVGQFGFHAL